jgi:hypothetical protein
LCSTVNEQVLPLVASLAETIRAGQWSKKQMAVFLEAVNQ